MRTIELTDSGKCLIQLSDENLTEFIVPKGVESILYEAFAECKHLQKVVIPDTVKNIKSNAFQGCTSIDKIEVEQGSRSFLWEDDALYDYDKKLLIKVSVTAKHFKIPNTVEKICDYAFQGNRYIEEIIIPNSVKIIRPNAFSDCKALRSLYIPNSVESIEHMDNMPLLKEIKIEDNSSFVVDNGIIYTQDFTKLVLMFNYDKTELEIPATVEEIQKFAFRNQNQLKKVKMQNGLKSIGWGAFYLCTNLETIIIPPSVEQIKAYAFNFCENLSEIYCHIEEPNNVTIDVFDYFSFFDNVTLYVPKTALKKYKKHPVFGLFKKIKELP